MGDLTEAGAQVVDGARHEADAYRGDNTRPLGGYVAVLLIYGAVVGRRHPRRGGHRPHVARAVAGARPGHGVVGHPQLSRTLTKDAVTSPLRAPFTRYAGTGGPAEVHEEVRKKASCGTAWASC